MPVISLIRRRRFHVSPPILMSPFAAAAFDFAATPMFTPFSLLIDAASAFAVVDIAIRFSLRAMMLMSCYDKICY